MSNSLTPREYITGRQARLVQLITGLRESHGLSQQDVADLLGCSRARIARLEGEGHGEYSLGELELLALRFGMEPTSLLTASLDHAGLEAVYAGLVTTPALGQRLTCPLPAGVTLSGPLQLKLVWSPDGRFLAGAVPATADNEKDILCVWDAATGGLSATVRTDDMITVLAFSPDSRLLATATSLDTIEVWAWERGEVAACLDPVDGGNYPAALWDFVGESEFGHGIITCLQFSPDGALLAAVNEDHGTLRLWDTATWQELRTLSLVRMFEAIDHKRIQFELGDSWRIVAADTAEPPSSYGHFPVRQLAFTPDGKMLAVLPFLSRRLEFFDLTGRYVRGETFARQMNCLDLMALNQSGEMQLVACGGDRQLFEVWYQRASFDREFIHAGAEIPRPPAAIRDIKILNARCVLAVVQTDEPRRWKITNLVTRQPLLLSQVHPEAFYVSLSPTGQAVAFPDAAGQVAIQQLRPEHLTHSAATLRLNLTRPQATTPAHLRSLFRQRETDEDWYASLRQMQAERPNEIAAQPPAAPIAVADWVERVRAAGAEGEAYGLTILPADDRITSQQVLAQLESAYPQARLIELPQPGPRIKERALLGYVAGRSLRGGEDSADIIAELAAAPVDVLVIDRAEKLHHQTLLAICGRLQSIAGVFLLLARNQAAFIAAVEKLRAGPDWFLSRAIWLQPPATPAEEVPATTLPEPLAALWPYSANFEFELRYLKSATPRAQGGYGLALLPPEDQTTVPRFIQRVQQQTTDQVALADLPGQGSRVKLRQLVEAIVGRPLQRGEPTKQVINTQIWRKYNIVVIDHAERLHPHTLLWICSNMRDIVDLFLLVARDEDALMKLADRTGQPDWALGRSIGVDLVALVAGD